MIRKTTLPAGLIFVATPIGAARDITLRALDTLASADIIAAEDTRTLRKLIEIHGISLGDRPLIAYHDHSGPNVVDRLVGEIAHGQSVAYASEAGTPLVSDPGFELARAVADAGFDVTSAPGPSAMIMALTVAGLPSDQFHFAGFPPNARGARQKFLTKLVDIDATLILYESPKRLAACLNDCASVLGGDRKAAMCRELTKKFEEVARGTLTELAKRFSEAGVKGEIVLVIDRGVKKIADVNTLEASLREALETMSIKDASAHVAEMLQMPKRQVYQKALDLKDGG